MMQPTSTIQADFDRLAPLSEDGWDHNSHYHDFLLRHVPHPCAAALDVGCGTGAFARRLAARADHVLAFDLSPQMVRVARERSRRLANVEFRVADALAFDFSGEQYDCIASLAALHHLPLPEMLRKMRRALRPGGVLMVLDLFEPEGLPDRLADAPAVLVHWALKLVKTGWRKEPRELTEAKAAHAAHDRFLTLREIRRVCAEELPGARVRRRLLWRTSIVWTKPSSAHGDGPPQ